MSYLLDTCTVSDYFRGAAEVACRTATRMEKAGLDHIALSSITLMELYYGFALYPAKTRQKKQQIEQWLGAISIMDYDAETAHISAEIRARLRTKGTPIGPYDLLIAATALQHGLILVTSNEREFARIPDLRIENWR